MKTFMQMDADIADAEKPELGLEILLRDQKRRSYQVFSRSGFFLNRTSVIESAKMTTLEFVTSLYPYVVS